MTDLLPMPVRLDTERLIMTPWTPDDAPDLCALHAERGGGTPTVAETCDLIADMLTATSLTGIALLPVRRRAVGDLIGYCGLIVGRSTVEEPEIAYELVGRAHGHGYATEAARAVVDAAAATGRSRLWSTVRVWNTASFRVLEKLGFARDHVTTDDRGELVWMTLALPARPPDLGTPSRARLRAGRAAEPDIRARSGWFRMVPGDARGRG